MPESIPEGAADEANAARASDIEQRLGQQGNSRDSEEEEASDDAQPSVTSDAVGSSGHVPLEEEAQAFANGGRSGSPGAEADQHAAERSGEH